VPGRRKGGEGAQSKNFFLSGGVGREGTARSCGDLGRKAAPGGRRKKTAGAAARWLRN